MEATTSTSKTTGLWALTSEGENLEQPATWAWTTVYPSRQAGREAADEMRADIAAEGNCPLWEESHDGPVSTWRFTTLGGGEQGSLRLEPLHLGGSYGATFC